MARKSRWQQFTDNFNAVYGTFTDAAKKIETAKVNKQEFTDESGAALTGLSLERARAAALADIYTKYGDPEGGLALRSKAEGLSSMSRDNDIGEATKADTIFQKGAGASGLLRANIDNTRMNTANTGSIMNERETLLPGRVVGQGLANESQSLNNEYARETLPWRIGGAENNYRTSSVDADVREATKDSTIAATDAENNAEVIRTEDLAVNQGLRHQAEEAKLTAQMGQDTQTALAVQQSIRDSQIIAEIIAGIPGGPYSSNQEGTQAAIDAIMSADISVEAKQSAVGGLKALGVEKFITEATIFSQQAAEAAKGGLKSVEKFYETYHDNVDLTFERGADGSITAYATDGNVKRKLATRSGEAAEEMLAQDIADLAMDPRNAIEIAAGKIGNDLKAAETKLKEAQTRNYNADAGVAEAEAAAANPVGLSAASAEKFLAELMTSEAFINAEPETQQRLILEYKKQFGLVEPVKPEASPNVPPRPNWLPQSMWMLLTDEEKMKYGR